MIKNDYDDKTDYELSLLIKKVRTLLNQNDEIPLNYDFNNLYESNNKINKFYILIKQFIIHNIICDNYNLLNFYNNIKYINNFNQKENKSNDNILYYYNNILEINKNIFININTSLNLKNIISENIIEDNNFSLKLNENLNEKINNKELIKTNIFLKKKRNIFKKSSKFSRYKGLSKNKNKWQVYIMINKKNTYLGSYTSAKFAAKVYDFMAIKKNGFKAKTNFIYDYRQIKTIYQLNIDIPRILELAALSEI